MNTDRETNQNENSVRNDIVVLSDEALDQVAGGLNPQPLPPGFAHELPIPVAARF